MVDRICSKCEKVYTDLKKSSMCSECRSKMGRRSKRKGAKNELRFAKKLQILFDKYGLGYIVRRTPRSGAIHEFEPSDLMFQRLPENSEFNRHFELKNSANWSIEEWFKKGEDIEREKGTNRPVTLVIRKPNSTQSFIVVDENDFIKLLIVLDLTKLDD